ncbi:MAG TPA: hypothetical protein QF641_00215 [Candidatus Thalassarchaeaceae archaeon]|nr:hypothetical protein [Candidatus Thalassarchaeaceae archaeon]
MTDDKANPPPPQARPPPPAPPSSKAPPTPKPQARPPPPAPPSSKAPPTPKPQARPPPKRRPTPPKTRPTKRPPTPKKGKPGQPPIGGKKKRSRRIKIKLGLRAKRLSEEVDTYTDQIGWTTSSAETVLSDLKDIEENIKKEPETLVHQCSMCGIRMEIPRPKRERYKVICAYPECGHEDMIGI